MDWPVIRKPSPTGDRLPNLRDYLATRSEFSWDQARRWLDGLPEGGLNIAHEAVDRHVAGRGDHAAVRIVHPDETVSVYSYRQLAADTSRFANALQALGVGVGDRVFTLLGRRYETFVTTLGALKNRSVVSPLFTAYGPEPVCQRLRLGDARVLVTTRTQYRRKVAPMRHELPNLRHVVIVDGA